MRASQLQPTAATGASPPGLLAWQAYLLAYAAGAFSLREPEPALAAAVLLWLGLALFRRPGAAVLAATLALTALCFAGGRWYAAAVLPPRPDFSPLVLEDNGRAQLSARVAEIADKPGERLEILLENCRAVFADNATLDVPGRVAWTWDSPGLRPAPGQRVEVGLRLRPVHGFANAGGFDYEWQQRLRGVFHRAYARGADIGAVFGPRPAGYWHDLREELRARLVRLLPPTQGGAIVLGLVMGERSRIDLTTGEELRAAGLTHTLALSGLNVVYVGCLGWALAWLAGLLRPGLYLRVPRQKLAIFISLPLLAAYVWLGQASPSLVRSAWMFVFWGGLLLLDRGRALVDGLFMALALMLLFDPLSVYDLGLQMSAGAVAGLALLHPWLMGCASRAGGPVGRCARWCCDALFMTLSANLALLPVMVWSFGVFAPNILLNLPWLPVQGFAVQLPGMVGLVLAAVPGLEGAAGWLLGAAAWVQDWMLAALSRLSALGLFPTWAVLRPLWPELLGFSLALSMAPFCRGKRADAALTLLLAGLLAMALPQGRMLQAQSRDEVRLTILDVGQSQSLLVTAPGGRRALIDGGGISGAGFDIGRSVVGPALTWGAPPRLDWVLMSHPDLDHAQGLAWVLRYFDVARLGTNGRWPEGRVGASLDAALAAGAPGPEALRAGQALELGPEVRLEVLHPSEGYEGRNANDNSLVLRLLWRGEPLALLPGDIQRDGIEEMIEHRRADLRAGVLVLPHHGSKSSLSVMLYEAVSPALAFASCGFQNMFHFPNKDVAAELSQRGISLDDTARAGMIELVWSAPGAAPHVARRRP